MSKTGSRRLAAIVSADVVGYSGLIEHDELGTIAALRTIRKELIVPATEARGGRLFKLIGDGALFEFSSVVQAVEAAIAVQSGISDGDIRFRVGVHLGDVVVDGDDLLGDGVNVAARIEAQAEPGGVALSDDAYRQVRDKLDIDWRDGGEQTLKNISRAVRVWHWSPGQAAPPATPDRTDDVAAKPSIAVLPFDNMSGDPEQEYFADGIVEDVTTALSFSSGLFVTSRSSAFSFRGQSVDIRTIAQQLGVRYVLEGSVRRAGQRVRVTAQLIEAATDTHVWAERYDRPVTDLFDIQDEITASVAGAVGSEISRAEMDRVSQKRIADLDAWERQMKGLWHIGKGSARDVLIAQEIFRHEIAEANGGAFAHGMLALALAFDLLWGFSGRPPTELIGEGLAVGRAGVALDGNDEVAHAMLGMLLWIIGEHDAACAAGRTAIRLNPNYAFGHATLGHTLAYCGPDHLQQACDSLERAIQIGPRDAFVPLLHANMGMARLIAGQYDAAVNHAQDAVDIDPKRGTALRVLTSALALNGQLDEAAITWARSVDAMPVDLPTYKASIFRLFKHDEDAEHYFKGLRLAGADI